MKSKSYECLDCGWQSTTKPDGMKCPDCATYVKALGFNEPKSKDISDLSEIGEKLKDKELFPESNKMAKEFLENVKESAIPLKTMEDKAKLFEKDSQENVLANAIVIASEAKDFKDENYAIYEYFDKTPKTSLVIELVEALNRYGYKITKI